MTSQSRTRRADARIRIVALRRELLQIKLVLKRPRYVVLDGARAIEPKQLVPARGA